MERIDELRSAMSKILGEEKSKEIMEPLDEVSKIIVSKSRDMCFTESLINRS